MENKGTLEGKVGLDTTIMGLIIEEEATISTRLANCLRTATPWRTKNNYDPGLGIETVRELLDKKHRLYKLPDFSYKSLEELNSILAKYGLPTLDLDMRKKERNCRERFRVRTRYY